jgi:DNA-directed RNA polymerase subunit beta'
MEHMVAAHGARRGQIAKSIKTADTGYLTRKLVHGSASAVVVCKDCGTTEGVTIDPKTIFEFFVKDDMSEEDKAHARQTTKDVMVRFISGRYMVNGPLISKKYARELAEEGKPVKIRSPLRCENPCCQKCYGIDPGTGHLVKIGTAVGILAAHSMSEPSTQLTMKQFQKGGVQGSTTSSFDRVEAILQQSDIKEAAKNGKYPTYDPVAWASGDIVKLPAPGGKILLKIQCTDPNDDPNDIKYKKNRIVPAGVPLKSGHINIGETMRSGRGDVYTPEIVEISGAYDAALAAVYTLYFLFRPECDLIPVHIETVVSYMIGYQPITTDIPAMRLGKSYTKGQLCTMGKDYSNTRFKVTFRGLLTSVSDNVNFMEALIMEDQKSVLSDAVVNCLVDMCDSPLVQVALGQKPAVGTGFTEDYLED